MDALHEIIRLHCEIRRTVRLGGEALGTAPGGADRAKGYLRALLDATVAVLGERTTDGQPISYPLARAVLYEQLSVDQALDRHARGIDPPG